MGNFSKLIGAVVGSVLGLAVALGFEAEWLTPELQAGLVAVLATVATFMFPANKTD